MRTFLTTTFVALGLLSFAPGFVDTAEAHGGAYRGPAGEVPPDSREPSDPPPPPESGGPKTPGGEGEGPETPDGGVGGPETGGGDPPPDAGGAPSGPAPPPSSGPSGPTTGGGGRGGGKKAPGYEDWTFWWNFNKDEILQLKSTLKRTQRGSTTGDIAHKFGSREQTGNDVVSATDAAIQTEIVPVLREMLDEKDLNFDIQSAAAIALSKIKDESIIDALKSMAKGKGDYHKVVQESAGLSFGLMQKNTEDVRDFLIELIQDKDNNSSFVRPFSAISLGLLGNEGDADGKVAEALIKVLAGKETKDDIKPACLVALGLLGDDAVVKPLMQMLETGKAGDSAEEPLTDTELAFVVQALGKIGNPGTTEPGEETVVIDAVRKILDGKKSNKNATNVRRSASIALAQLAPQCSRKLQKEILSDLKRVSASKKRDKDSSVRNFATISIGRMGATEGIDPETRTDAIKTLQYLLDNSKPASIAEPFAGLGLGLIGRAMRMEGKPTSDMEELIRKPLRDKFEETNDARAKGSYAISSGLVGDPLAVDSFVKVLKDRGEDKRLRGYCAVALGMIGAPDAKEAIAGALTDGNNRELRVQTSVAAGLMGDASVIDPLVKIMDSGEESQYILGSVALALGQIGDERAIEPLVKIANDEENKFPDLTRALATVALGQIGDRADIPTLARVARDINYRAHVPALAELLTIL